MIVCMCMRYVYLIAWAYCVITIRSEEVDLDLI